MDWLDDLLEIHLSISFVHCSNCSDCSTKPESTNLFSICWMYTGMYMYVALRTLSHDGPCAE